MSLVISSSSAIVSRCSFNFGVQKCKMEIKSMDLARIFLEVWFFVFVCRVCVGDQGSTAELFLALSIERRVANTKTSIIFRSSVLVVPIP